MPEVTVVDLLVAVGNFIIAVGVAILLVRIGEYLVAP